MNYINITLLSLFGVTVITHTVFFFLKIKIPAIIFSSLEIPFVFGTTLSFLIKYIPDSLHLIFFYSAIMIFITIAVIFFNLDIKHLNKIAQILMVIGTGILCHLFGTVFFKLHIAAWTYILAIIFFAISYTITALLSKKQNLPYYFSLLLPMGFSVFFMYITALTIYAYPNLSSILLFCGSVLLYFTAIIFNLSKTRFSLKFMPYINQIILLTSIILISTATILMVK